jgi:uncharacterized membrane protein YdjX (TVP38/TMEM64 family)
MDIKDTIKKILWVRFIIGIVIGSIGGYLYYYFIGCESGSCAIQSDPVNMTLYGALMGGVLFFGSKKTKNENLESSK